MAMYRQITGTCMAFLLVLTSFTEFSLHAKSKKRPQKPAEQTETLEQKRDGNPAVILAALLITTLILTFALCTIPRSPYGYRPWWSSSGSYPIYPESPVIPIYGSPRPTQVIYAQSPRPPHLQLHTLHSSYNGYSPRYINISPRSIPKDTDV